MQPKTFDYPRLALLALVCLLAGCTTAPPATPAMDTQGKSFAVAPGKANIYLYRNENIGGSSPMTVSINGNAAGATGRATYFLWQVDPGTYDISSKAENTSTVRVVAEAGKSYYVWQAVQLDRRFYLLGVVLARSELQLVDDETGRWGVQECTRLRSAL